MKFVRLEVAGFGPFRKAQLIDFARCNSERLFMVAGQTGSGKTTLLDAISFALYGETTGSGQGSGEADGRQPSDVRCAACTPKDETYVTLEFEVVRGRFRIRRNPEYPRAAKSGVGITKETAKFTLEQMTEGSWRLVPNLRKVSDFTQFVETLVGLTAEQFRQVIVVPQGRFREVLLSTPAERKELLTHIFGTHLYERFTERVKVQARERKAKLDQLHSNLRFLVKDFAWAWLADVPGRAGAESEMRMRPLAEIVEEADRRLKEASEAKAKADKECKDAQDGLNGAIKALDGARHGNELLSRLDNAISARDKAADAVKQLQPTRDELSAAIRCARAADALDAESAAQRKLADALGKVEALVARETPLHELWSKAHEALTEAEDAYAHPSTGYKALGDIIQETQARLADLKAAATRRSEIRGSLSELRAQQPTLEKACQDAADAVEKAADADRAASTQLQNAVNAQRASRAALLAKELRPGCECPVCGSVQHPKIASSDQPVVSDEEIAALETSAKQARNRAAAAESEKGKADLRLASVIGDVRKLESDLATRGTDPDSEIGSTETRIATLSTAQQALLRNREDAERSEGKAKDDLEACKREVANKTGSADTARVHFDDAKRLREEAMSAIGEDDPALVHSARRSAEWIASTARRIEIADRALVDAQGREDNARETAGNIVRTDLAPLETRVSECTLERDATETLATNAVVESSKLSNLAEGLKGLAKALSDAETDLAPAEALASVIVGATGEQRISLHAWVLGAYLDEVLSVASRRMHDMTRGRYELHRLQEQQDKRTEAGLSIAVHDSHTGTSRAARTLSGGETFLASLSMALALAEVAGARGGHALDTIFIDEGFGSLDSESLNVAMDVLNQLKAAGRIVGLISHVEEMRRCVHASIHVVKDPATGTSTVSQS
jgi:exonuclease SbcC